MVPHCHWKNGGDQQCSHEANGRGRLHSQLVAWEAVGGTGWPAGPFRMAGGALHWTCGAQDFSGREGQQWLGQEAPAQLAGAL